MLSDINKPLDDLADLTDSEMWAISFFSDPKADV